MFSSLVLLWVPSTAPEGLGGSTSFPRGCWICKKSFCALCFWGHLPEPCCWIKAQIKYLALNNPSCRQHHVLFLNLYSIHSYPHTNKTFPPCCGYLLAQSWLWFFKQWISLSILLLGKKNFARVMNQLRLELLSCLENVLGHTFPCIPCQASLGACSCAGKLFCHCAATKIPFAMSSFLLQTGREVPERFLHIQSEILAFRTEN